MPRTRRERCPYCGFLDVIKWGKQCGHQRFKCKNCGSLFTFRRKDISQKNRFIWFEWWILRKQTVPQISQMSGCSERQLYRWFDEYLDQYPQWHVQRREKASYKFAYIPPKQDLKNIDGIRMSYTATLTTMAALLDLIRGSFAKI